MVLIPAVPVHCLSFTFYDAPDLVMHYSWLGPELFHLLLGPPGLNG